MTTKHTPGPWSYDGHGINSCAESHKGERIFKTCLDYSHGSADRERAVADSNLVAAAPELLEALNGLLMVLTVSGKHSYRPDSDTGKAIANAQAAFAKAEGK